MKKLSFSKCIQIVLVFGLVLSFFVTFLSQSSYAADRKKTLVIVSVKEAVTLDPQVSLDGQSPLIWRGVYEPLLGLKGDTYEVTPGLARKWEVSDNGKTYTFYLQKGVKFHDGSPLNAQCIKYTLERSKALKKAGSYVLDPVKEIIVVDDYTLKIELSSPVRSFLSAMAGMYTPSWALNPDWVKTHEEKVEKEGNT